jgi:hypothetical protein
MVDRAETRSFFIPANTNAEQDITRVNEKAKNCPYTEWEVGSNYEAGVALLSTLFEGEIGGLKESSKCFSV